MSGNIVDLHMHSSFSEDGEFLPTEIVDMCHQSKIGMMAITDHNCIKANCEAFMEAYIKGIRYLPATEVDCMFDNTILHVLGYMIDFESPDFLYIESNIRAQGKAVSLESLRLTNLLGYDLTEEELGILSKESYWPEIWSGEMFAEVILNDPKYLNDERLFPYRKNGLRGDNPYLNFYFDFYAPGKECYVKTEYPKLSEVLSIIKDNKGRAILAHPGVNLFGRYDLFENIISCGLDGVEAFSSYHDKETAGYFFKETLKHRLIPTCGSDFHGKTKPSVQIGRINFHGIVNETEAYETLFRYFA